MQGGAPRFLIGAFTSSLLVTFAACSTDPGGPSGGAAGSGTGGSTVASGGSMAGGTTATSGGTTNGGSSLGGTTATSGGTITNGGSTSGGTANGGSPQAGSSQGGSKGGATSAGASNGGAANGGKSGGGETAAGGAAQGGASKGGASSGGSAGSKSGGGASSGGATSGGSSSGGSGGGSASCPGGGAAELNLVKSWLNNTAAKGALPQYAYDNIGKNFPAGAAFDKLACSIVMSCVEFAPAETNWLRKCEAVITSAIVAESSYNPLSIVNDTYATRSVGGVTANDPTIGLLQIRFSSTVHDYNFYGPPAKMAAIGCNWPAALTSQADTASWWATQGGTTYLSFMQDVPCNVGLATWYYFYNATGNGGSSAVWISDYCGGKGVAGNMVVGLLSHLMGGSYPRPADTNNAYPWGIECCAGGNPSVTTCTGCTGRVASFLGIATSSARPSPDPFTETLAPQPTKYCK